MKKCISCGGDIEIERKYAFKSKVFGEVYTDGMVYKCNSCSLSQVNADKIDLAKLTEYYRSAYRNIASLGDAPKSVYQARARALLNIGKGLVKDPRRVFEVGAGYGFNLVAFAEAYPTADVFTDEIDETVELNRRIRKGELCDGDYDVVIMSHVLEHFVDPVERLARALDALSPRGVVIIEVPNDVPEAVAGSGADEPHVSFFTRETLRDAIARSGGQLIDIFTAGPTYRKNKAAGGVRALVLKIVAKNPIVKRAFYFVRDLRKRSVDFENRNESGMYLRAVMTRKAV